MIEGIYDMSYVWGVCLGGNVHRRYVCESVFERVQMRGGIYERVQMRAGEYLGDQHEQIHSQCRLQHRDNEEYQLMKHPYDGLVDEK